MANDLEIQPGEVKKRLESGEAFLLVDVREPWEHATAKIEGARLIPLREIPANLPALDAAKDVVLFCHHGTRSMNATAWLREQGISGARSMAGGIDRWAVEIDPTVPRY